MSGLGHISVYIGGSGFSCNKINISSVYGTDRANGWIELGR